jgi:hypothetical protein
MTEIMTKMNLPLLLFVASLIIVVSEFKVGAMVVKSQKEESDIFGAKKASGHIYKYEQNFDVSSEVTSSARLWYDHL